jgi:hypothetical protein
MKLPLTALALLLFAVMTFAAGETHASTLTVTKTDDTKDEEGKSGVWPAILRSQIKTDSDANLTG